MKKTFITLAALLVSFCLTASAANYRYIGEATDYSVYAANNPFTAVSGSGIIKTGDAFFAGGEKGEFVVTGDTDCDGRIRTADARLTLRKACGIEQLSPVRTAAADADGNGKVTADDAAKILRYAADISDLPVPFVYTEPKKATNAYFGDVLMVGDSITDALRLRYGDRMGNVTFFCSGSLSAMNNAWSTGDTNSVQPKINGRKTKIQDACAYYGKKLIYIMLGINDLGMGADYSFRNYSALLADIAAKCPSSVIVVESVSPVANGGTTLGYISLSKINDYNERLKKLCAEKGYVYLAVDSVLKDAEGYLKREYCSDIPGMGIHMTAEGCAVWADYILSHPVRGYLR